MEVEVTCPDHCTSGDVVSFISPDGHELTTTVPDGIAAGETFMARVEEEAQQMMPQPAEAAAVASDLGLLFALVEHAQRILEKDMAPFLEAKCLLFDQPLDELTSGQGETLEQYAAFKEYEQQLEVHFDSFVASRGFGSAADCFAVIDRTMVEDAARQKREMAELQERLEQMQREIARAAQREAEGGDEGGGEGGENEIVPGHTMPLLLFAQPIGAKELVEQTLTLADYQTFAGLMRKKARQVSLRRRFLDASEERARARTMRASRLSTLATSDAVESTRQLWEEMHSRMRDNIAESLPPPLREMMEAEYAAELEALGSLLLAGDAPPTSDKERLSLGRLSTSAVSKAANMSPPQLMPAIFAEVQRVGAAVEAGEQGCVAVLMDAVVAAHGLIDTAEQATEQLMHTAEAKAATFRTAYENGQPALEDHTM